MKKAYLHYTIQKTILDRILGGMYPPGMRIPGTQDFVAEFATSSVTIDKALTGLVEQGLLTRKTRKGTFVTAKENWRLGAETHKTESIFYGMIMRDSSAPYFWKNTARGIHDGVLSYDFGSIFGYINEDLPSALEHVDGLLRKNVRGIIFAPLSMPTEKEYEDFNAALADRITEKGVPLVLIDRQLKSREISSIVSRDYQAAVEITGRLIDAGVRNPVCLTHLFNSAFAARVKGFCDTLRKRGFSDPESRVIDPAPDKFLFDGTFEQLPECDGIFSVNAANLFACLNAVGRGRTAREKNLLYANFDDIGFLHIEGLIVSAVQRSHHIGYLAVRLLEEMILKNTSSNFTVIEDYEFQDHRDTPSMS